jgi:hypothetical protein
MPTLCTTQDVGGISFGQEEVGLLAAETVSNSENEWTGVKIPFEQEAHVVVAAIEKVVGIRYSRCFRRVYCMLASGYRYLMKGCKVRDNRSTGLRYISGYMTGALSGYGDLCSFYRQKCDTKCEITSAGSMRGYI